MKALGGDMLEAYGQYYNIHGDDMRGAIMTAIWAAFGLLMFTARAGLAAEPLNVVATIPPLHSVVSAVMEGQGKAVPLVKGASSEHTYAMRPSAPPMWWSV